MTYTEIALNRSYYHKDYNDSLYIESVFNGRVSWRIGNGAQASDRGEQFIHEFLDKFKDWKPLIAKT